MLVALYPTGGGAMNFLGLLLLFLMCGSEASFPSMGGSVPGDPGEADQVREALKEVFQMSSDEDLQEYPHRSFSRKDKHLEYMKRLYRKITTGELTLPSYSDTIKTVAAKTDFPSNDGNSSLLYQLSKSHNEKITMAALHMTGHRELHRPRRILLSLTHTPNGVLTDQELLSTNEFPSMNFIVKKFPMEVDLTVLVQRAVEENPPKLLRVKMEQLRNGQWVPFSSRKLSHNPPFLVIFSGDADLDEGGEMLKRDSEVGVGDNAPLQTNISNSMDHRFRRSIEQNDILSNEIPFRDPDSTLKLKTDFWNLGDSKEEKDDIFTYNDDLDNEIFITNHEKGDQINPIKKHVETGQESMRKKKLGPQFEEDEDAFLKSSLEEDQETNSVNILGSNSKLKYGKSPKFSVFDENLKQWKTSKRKKFHRRKIKSGGLLPSPEQYAKWNKWQNPKTNKKKRNRNKRKHRKSKRQKGRKSAPLQWLPNEMNWGSKETARPEALPDGETNRDLCKRKQLYVDFKELGWDKFIIAPEGYDTFYCEGNCSLPLHYKQNITSHAIIQSILRFKREGNKGPELPAPCCAPDVMSTRAILWLDNSDRIVLKKIKNLVVVSCTCQ